MAAVQEGARGAWVEGTDWKVRSTVAGLAATVTRCRRRQANCDFAGGADVLTDALVRCLYGVFQAERCVNQKAHLRARAAKGAESRFEEERTRAEESRNSISPAKARPEVGGSVEALDGLGLEGDAFMPVFEEAFPVMEVIEVQAGVAEWRRYRRG